MSLTECRDSSRPSRGASGRRSGKKPRSASPKRRPRRKVYYGSRCRNSSITWSSGSTPPRMETPRVFKKSTVANLGDFLATFDFRNIANDSELKEQVDKARVLLAGVTAEEIRNADNVRRQVNKRM